MTRTSLGLALCAALAGAGRLGAAEPMNAPMARLNTLQDRAFGVLLLGEGGDRDWKDQLDDLLKRLSAQMPVAFAQGSADGKAIQKEVDRLQAAHIKKLVVVPLYVTSNSPLMDQTRFLFGIREDPSREFFAASRTHAGYSVVRRVQARTSRQADMPVVLAPALDDHPLVVELLAARALKLSKRASDEALVLVGLAPAASTPSDDALPALGGLPPPRSAVDEYRQTLASLAERVRAKAGFKSARGAVLLPDALHQSERQSAQEELRKQVRELSRGQRVLVVPHVMTGTLAKREVLRALTGVFMHYSEKGLLPDERITAWVEASIRQGASLPDMRAYKDDGRAVPQPGAAKGKPTRLKPAQWSE